MTLDQTQIEVKIQTVLIQTLGIEIIARIVQEILQTTENETLQIFKIEIIRITDHKTIPRTDQKIINLIIESVIILQTQTTTTGTDQENILSHHIKEILEIRKWKIETIEAVHRNIKDQFIK